MNKEEIESKFELFVKNAWFDLDKEEIEVIKEYIFDDIVKEVLKSVLWKDVTIEINWIDILDYEKIKQKTKDNFWIDL